jgi:AraC-like DNA-binding protein
VREAIEASEFRANPCGRFHVGLSFLVWCWDRTLCGSVVWGRPSEAEARALVALYEIEDALDERFDVVTDASRMELVAPAVFAVVAGYLRDRLPTLGPRIRKNAIVTQPGLIGAAITGLYPMLAAQVKFRPVTSTQAALDWIDTPATRAARLEVESLSQPRPSPLVALRAYLKARLAVASIEDAAAALGVSRRTLQRSLSAAGTTFRAELEALRVVEAQRQLSDGDDKIEAIAAELGYASASHFGASYRRITGELPSAFRRRHRGR